MIFHLLRCHRGTRSTVRYTPILLLLASIVLSQFGTYSAKAASTAVYPCYPVHGLSGGSAASNNATNVTSGHTRLCMLHVTNTSATLAYLKLYDLSTAPTCSSATGLKHVFPIPANTSGAGFVNSEGSTGEYYTNGFGFCLTGGGGDTDNSNAPVGVFVEGSQMPYQ